MRLADFERCQTPDAFIETAGGDLRTAEVAAWGLWERNGKENHGPYSSMAIAISERKFTKGAVS